MIVHSYIQTQGGMGLGDFLRGSMACHQLCCAERSPLILTFKDHPIGKYLVSPTASLDLHIHDFNNQCVQLHDLRRKLNALCGRKRVRGCQTGVLCNTFPRFPINQATKQFMMDNLVPCHELDAKIKEQTPTEEYEVIHIRFGDLLAYNTAVNFTVEYDIEEITQRLCRDISHIVKSTSRHIILMCDSTEMKKVISSRCGISATSAQSVHLNIATENDPISDTLVDFFILTKAKAIHQFSVHGWGSTFSNVVHWIYDVPLHSRRILE